MNALADGDRSGVTSPGLSCSVTSLGQPHHGIAGLDPGRVVSASTPPLARRPLVADPCLQRAQVVRWGIQRHSPPASFSCPVLTLPILFDLVVCFVPAPPRQIHHAPRRVKSRRPHLASRSLLELLAPPHRSSSQLPNQQKQPRHVTMRERNRQRRGRGYRARTNARPDYWHMDG